MKKPNALMIAFGKPHGDGGDEHDDEQGPEEESHEEPSEEEVSAAGELKTALKGGDDTEIAMALKNFVSECLRQEHEEGEY